MRPIYFDRCFGWIHAPPATLSSGSLDSASLASGRPTVGVVICAALAQEELNTHHGFMILAERLAAAGVPALRFDYAGLGDSAPEEVCVRTLTASVLSAVACLRQETGVGRIILCGLRVGGALACLAAAELDGVAGLILLAPTLSGKTFVRELRAAAGFSSLSLLDPVPVRGVAAPLNTNGFSWSHDFLTELAGIDLGSPTVPPAPRMLVAGLPRDRRISDYVEKIRAAGALVEERSFNDYDAYLRDSTINEVPDATFAAVVHWASELARDTASQEVWATTPAVRCRVSRTLAVDQAEEEPTRFGRDDGVFGVLCRPSGRPANGIAALIMHEGSSHHIGNGGTTVTLARRLADAGFVSLRMDLTGMGDSAPAPPDDTPYYNLNRVAEVGAGLDRLEREGIRRVVVLGLCAGGYMAFHAGRDDPRIVGIVIVNLQKFIWLAGDSVTIAVRGMRRSLRSYLRSMRNPGEWKRVLLGKADILGTVRVLGGRFVTNGVRKIRSALPPKIGSPVWEIREEMQKLSDRGVHTHFVYSADDPGLGEMVTYFGPGARNLKRFAPARLTVMADADHHLNGRDARRRFMDLVSAILTDVAAAHASDARPIQQTRPELERAAG